MVLYAFKYEERNRNKELICEKKKYTCFFQSFLFKL